MVLHFSFLQCAFATDFLWNCLWVSGLVCLSKSHPQQDPTDLNGLMTCKIILIKPNQNKNLVEEKAVLETVYKEMWVCKHMYVYTHVCIHIFIQAQVCIPTLSTYRQAKQHTLIEGIIKKSVWREEMSILHTSVIWNWSQVILRWSIYYSVLLALTYIYNLSST